MNTLSLVQLQEIYDFLTFSRPCDVASYIRYEIHQHFFPPEPLEYDVLVFASDAEREQWCLAVTAIFETALRTN